MKLYDLKVNHLTNPLGFRMVRTVFSWKVAESVGKRQKAARLRVASDKQMQNLLFDSDWDGQADSLGYRADIALKPCTRYYWTVAVVRDWQTGAAVAGAVDYLQ